MVWHGRVFLAFIIGGRRIEWVYLMSVNGILNVQTCSIVSCGVCVGRVDAFCFGCATTRRCDHPH
jgi:hypothetical protein